MFELNVLNFVGHIQGLALEEAIVVFYLLSDFFFLQRGNSSLGVIARPHLLPRAAYVFPIIN